MKLFDNVDASVLDGYPTWAQVIAVFFFELFQLLYFAALVWIAAVVVKHVWGL